MVQPNHPGGLPSNQMNPIEAKQTFEMQQLVAEFPQADQIEIVNIYFNDANQNIAMAR